MKGNITLVSFFLFTSCFAFNAFGEGESARLTSTDNRSIILDSYENGLHSCVDPSVEQDPVEGVKKLQAATVSKGCELGFCFSKGRKEGTGSAISHKFTYTCGDAASKSAAAGQVLALFGLSVSDLCGNVGCSSACLADNLYSEYGDGVDLQHHGSPDCYYYVNGSGGKFFAKGCSCP